MYKSSTIVPCDVDRRASQSTSTKQAKGKKKKNHNSKEMNNPISAWDNEYARLARAASQLRTTSPNTAFHSNQQRQGQASSIQAGINRLASQLSVLESNLSLNPAEAQRRQSLLEGLSSQMGAEGVPGAGGGRGESSTAAALRQQDGMIDELAMGVSRLKNQTNLIHEEATSHVRLLDEMDNNVDLANQGLEEETRRAMRLSQERSVWRLHLVIVALSILLFLLILMGLS